MTGSARRALAASPAVAFALVAGLLAGPADATGDTRRDGGYEFFDSAFILRLRAAAVEPELDIPNPLVPGVGHSAVNLEKDTAGPYARCEARGRVRWSVCGSCVRALE